MKNFKITAFLFTIIIFFNGCYKDSFEFTPGEKEEPPLMIVGDIDDYFSSVQEELDSFTFKAEEGFLFVTENNTVLEVIASSFVDQNGEVIDGEIDFKYIEILNPSEYAFYNLPTISDGRRLRTEGVFKFEAYHEGKAVKLKEGKGVTVRLPDENPEPGMQLFYGEGDGEDFNWVTQSIDTGTDSDILITEWFTAVDTGNQQFVEGFGYLFTCDLFTWINVDIFIDIPESERTKVCVELPEQYSPENTVVFMFFNGEQSILALYPDADQMKWCEPYGATPIGSNVTFLSISSLGEDVFHLGIERTEVTEDMNLFIEPEEKTLDEIIEIIKKLE